MAGFNNENDFRRIILKSVSPDIHLVDIPDEGKRIAAIHPDVANLIVEKPYDMGMLYKGKFAALELKNESTSLTFNRDKIAPHQLRNLRHAVKCGGLGFVLVRFKKGLSAQGRKRLNTLKYAIDICYLLDIQWIDRKKVTSYPIELLQAECVELPFDIFQKKYDLKVIWQKKVPIVKN